MTDSMLDVFVEFDGDEDGYARSGRPPLDIDWHVVDAFLQRLVLVRTGQASESLSAEVAAELNGIADDACRRRLWQIAGERAANVYGSAVV